MNQFTKKGICALMVAIILMGGMFSYPKQSTAISVVEIGNNMIQNTISAIKNVEGMLKEYVLDSLALQIAKSAIASITNSIVNWINSGFQGSPAFAVDLQSLLRDIGDDVFQNFMSQLGAGDQSVLCSPFALDVKIAVTVDHFQTQQQKNQCTIDTVLGNAQNLQNFIGGNFAQGGWRGWFELTTKPQNNPYGSFLAVKSDLDARVGVAKSQVKEELSWGNGFLSSKDCASIGANQRYIDVVNAVSGRNPGVPISQEGNQICAIKTPGKVIEQQLEHVLGSGVRQLELADELNEIVNALIAQLAQQVLTGAGGLLGVSNSGGGGGSGGSASGQSYLDQLVQSQQQTAQGASSSGIVSQIQNVISQEQGYLGFKQQSLDAVLSAEAALAPLAACPADATFVAISQATINNLRGSLQGDISDSQSALSALSNLQSQAQSATTPQQVTSINTQLQTLQSNGTVHTQQEMIVASTQASSIQNQMSTITSQAQTRLATCTP